MRTIFLALALLFAGSAVADYSPSTIEHAFPSTASVRTIQAPIDSRFIAAYEGRHGEVIILEAATGLDRLVASHNFYVVPAGKPLPANFVLELIGVAHVTPNAPPVLIYRLVTYSIP